MAEAKKLKVTLVRSVIGRLQNHKDGVRALRLRLGLDAVDGEDTPAIRGMINKVNYLLEVEAV